jgi:hypothetical protein
MEPESSHMLGIVVPDREPESPLTRELLAVATQLDIGAEIAKYTLQSWPAMSAALS